MQKEEVMLHLNRIFNQLVEKYGPEEAILMFEETVEVAKLVSRPIKGGK
jgi:hypothetical protein